MGKHRLEIELTDDLLSRIDSVSARTSHSRMDVVVETLREHLPEVDGADAGSGNLQTPPFLMRLIEVLRLKVYRSDRDLQLFTTNGRGIRAPAGLALQSLSEA